MVLQNKFLTRSSNRTKGAVTFFAKTRKKTARTFCRLAWRYMLSKVIWLVQSMLGNLRFL